MNLLFMGRNLNKLLTAIVLIIPIYTYANNCEYVRDSIFTNSVDSIKLYMPECEGMRIIDCVDRRSFISAIELFDMKPLIITRKCYPDLMHQLTAAMQSSKEITKLPYTTAELHLRTLTSGSNNRFPGVQWVIEEENSCIRACAILYCDSYKYLIWISLDCVYIQNYKIKCDAFNILYNHFEKSR